MRPRLLLLFVAAALLAQLSGTSRAGAGTAACTATATGKHVRTELLKVHLTGTCPGSGVAHGTLAFSQSPASTPIACSRSTTRPERCGWGCPGSSR
jgi:hypothetical protein